MAEPRLDDNHGGTTATAKPKTKTLFHSNPVITRLGKVSECAVDGNTATYGGITVKSLYFVLITLVGLVTYIAVNANIFSSQYQFTYVYEDTFTLSYSLQEVMCVGAFLVVGIITQLLACFLVKTIPVTGTIYSFSQGFVISFMVFKLLSGYEYLAVLALVITMLVVAIMAVLYTSGIIKVNKKFRTIMTTLFVTMIAVSLLSVICYFIPFTSSFVSSIMSNYPLSIGLSVLSIIIAALFLVSDFAVIDHTVKNSLPAKYEWSAAFGLVFTVIWLYVKILDLIIRIFVSSKN